MHIDTFFLDLRFDIHFFLDILGLKGFDSGTVVVRLLGS